MAGEGEHDRRGELSRASSSPYVSLTDRQGSPAAGTPPKAKTDVASSLSAGGGNSSSNEKALMKRTLVAQSKKIQQLTAKIDGMETERGALAQQVWDVCVVQRVILRFVGVRTVMVVPVSPLQFDDSTAVYTALLLQHDGSQQYIQTLCVLSFGFQFFTAAAFMT